MNIIIKILVLLVIIFFIYTIKNKENFCLGSRCRVKVLGGGRYEVDGYPKDDGYPKCGCSLSGYCGGNCQGRYWLKEPRFL